MCRQWNTDNNPWIFFGILGIIFISSITSCVKTTNKSDNEVRLKENLAGISQMERVCASLHRDDFAQAQVCSEFYRSKLNISKELH